jgi:inositol-1,4,5-trisphosphate 5-phosphatase
LIKFLVGFGIVIIIKPEFLAKIIIRFEEGKINFLPTFKYKNNTDNFDADNINKLPAWTDRILFTKRTTNFSVLDVQLIEYNSMQNIIMSDHKPVYSYFNISIRI